MINSVTPVGTGTTKASIFYCNDIHGRLGNMTRIKTMSDRFDAAPMPDTAKLKLASGDIPAGADEKHNRCAFLFMNAIGIQACAAGNHDLDAGTKQLAQLMQDSKFDLLGANVNIDPANPLNNIIVKSCIKEQDGQRYGIIGVMPTDLRERIKPGILGSQISVDDVNKTIADVQAEADKFKAAGINKVIVLSHCGFDKDRIIARQVSDVDVILGGHSHDLVKDIKEGVNLEYSPKGAPVVITQAGKDGEYAGVLNLEFDADGIIKKARNSVIASKDFKSNLPLQAAFEQILGPAEKLGFIKSAPPPPEDRRVDPNPHMYFILDAMRHELGTDIALINAGNCRGFFEAGPVDSRKVFEVVPMGNRVVTLYLTEKEIVDALKNGAKSFVNHGHKPNIIMTSGLKYTVSRKGEIESVSIIDKQGKENFIDINNPDPEKTYYVVTDNFLASGGDGLLPDKNITKEYELLFNYDKDKLTCDYIKKLNTPIEIKDDGRITVVD